MPFHCLYYLDIVDEENVVITNQTSLAYAARLLEVTEADLQSALTQRAIAANGDVMMKTHSVVEADHGRDALSKAIYDRLFTWIIGRINKSIIVPGHKSKKTFNNVLGVLDIYGFEIFERNSFEQFCINYCNEKLQQLFIGGFDYIAE